jgi:hypothetical protein
MAQPESLIDDSEQGRAVLVVRCGGQNGRCGKVQAVVLDDGTTRNSRVECHRFDDDFRDHAEVRVALRTALADWERARQSGRAFKVPSIVLRPLPAHLREDQQTRQGRVAFESWMDWHEPDWRDP